MKKSLLLAEGKPRGHIETIEEVERQAEAIYADFFPAKKPLVTESAPPVDTHPKYRT